MTSLTCHQLITVDYFDNRQSSTVLRTDLKPNPHLHAVETVKIDIIWARSWPDENDIDILDESISGKNKLILIEICGEILDQTY